MSGLTIQVALVITSALCVALLVGCSDTQPERLPTAQAGESSIPNTPSSTAPAVGRAAAARGVARHAANSDCGEDLSSADSSTRGSYPNRHSCASYTVNRRPRFVYLN